MTTSNNNTSDSSPGHRLEEIARRLELDLESPSSARHQGQAANEPQYAALGGEELFKVCGDTERTQHLTRLAGFLVGKEVTTETAAELCLAWNAHNEPPLPDAKIRETVASIARTHARNHPLEEVDDTPLFDLDAASVGRFIGKPVPARDWVLENCLPLGKVGLLVAPGGTGKSQLILQLGYAIATGLGKYTPWKPGKAGQVLIICAEDEEDELHRRFDRLLTSDVQGRGRKRYYVI